MNGIVFAIGFVAGTAYVVDVVANVFLVCHMMFVWKTGYHPVPVGRNCNWSAPVGTSIPDSHSRACSAPLPDGRIFLVGAQILKGRDPLVLSLSSDGLAYDQVYALRVCVTPDCEPRFGGPPGFQYPAAMWRTTGVSEPEILFSYSVNKEDIAITRFPLSVLMK
eukprot:m.1420498 g.1420498  ORF g.1420498 m.1420498 type:complete len:164 (+) comp25045_c1_seq36:1692-2183(+)